MSHLFPQASDQTTLAGEQMLDRQLFNVRRKQKPRPQRAFSAHSKLGTNPLPSFSLCKPINQETSSPFFSVFYAFYPDSDTQHKHCFCLLLKQAGIFLPSTRQREGLKISVPFPDSLHLAGLNPPQMNTAPNNCRIHLCHGRHVVTSLSFPLPSSHCHQALLTLLFWKFG